MLGFVIKVQKFFQDSRKVKAVCPLTTQQYITVCVVELKEELKAKMVEIEMIEGLSKKAADVLLKSNYIRRIAESLKVNLKRVAELEKSREFLNKRMSSWSRIFQS